MKRLLIWWPGRFFRIFLIELSKDPWVLTAHSWSYCWNSLKEKEKILIIPRGYSSLGNVMGMALGWNALVTSQWSRERWSLWTRMSIRQDTLCIKDLFDVNSNWLKHGANAGSALTKIPVCMRQVILHFSPATGYTSKLSQSSFIYL